MVLIISLFSACGKNTITIDNSETSSTTSSSPSAGLGCIAFDPYATMKDEIGKTIKFAVWEDTTKTAMKVPLSRVETDIGLKYEQLIIPKAKYVDTLKFDIKKTERCFSQSMTYTSPTQ